MKCLFRCALLLATAYQVALASGTATGTVTTYVTGSQAGQEYLLVYFSSIANQPTCARGPGAQAGRFILTASAPNYKSVLATVVAAYFSGTPLLAEGLGTCSSWPNTDDLAYVCPGVGPGGC